MKKQISTRRNRKQEYINGLTHDINWYNEMISSKKLLHWVHGERKMIFEIIEDLSDMLTELRTIETVKGYKPWKENPID